MEYKLDIDRPATLRTALAKCYNGETLRRLARTLDVAGPTNKADLAAAVAGAVLGRGADSRRPADTFARLTELEKGAIAEALHDPNHQLDAPRFEAKYGSVPKWPDRWSRERTGLLGAFLMPGVSGRVPVPPFIPDDLAPSGARLT